LAFEIVLSQMLPLHLADDLLQSSTLAQGYQVQTFGLLFSSLGKGFQIQEYLG
jgi:hypothetical protein